MWVWWLVTFVTVLLAHKNQLPLPRLWSAAGLECTRASSAIASIHIPYLTSIVIYGTLASLLVMHIHGTDLKLRRTNVCSMNMHHWRVLSPLKVTRKNWGLQSLYNHRRMCSGADTDAAADPRQCTPGIPGICHADASCIQVTPYVCACNPASSYRCQCYPSYIGDGLNCTREIYLAINENASRHIYHIYLSLKNWIEYAIKCFRQKESWLFVLSTAVCCDTDVDECAVNNGGCSPCANCTNTPGN